MTVRSGKHRGQAEGAAGWFTQRQASVTAKVDSKTLQKLMKELEITPTLDQFDRRVRLLSHEQVQQLSVLARQRRRFARSASAPPHMGAAQTRIVTDFSQHFDQLQQAVANQADAAKNLENAASRLEARSDMMIMNLEDKNAERISQLEERVERAVDHFRHLTAELEAFVTSMRDKAGG